VQLSTGKGLQNHCTTATPKQLKHQTDHGITQRKITLMAKEKNIDNKICKEKHENTCK
jgi:hypothetical protein